MIVHDVPQGSEAWKELRLGIPTASAFHRLMTAKTLKPSAAATGYLYELLAEEMIGEACDEAASGFMTRGTALEEDAATLYTFKRNIEPEVVGFVTTDNGKVGCSPDRLVGADGLLEIKCPAAKVFVSLMLGGIGHEFRSQIQGQLLVTERAWCDLMVYNPLCPPIIQRHEVDHAWREAFLPILTDFVMELDDGRKRLDAMTASETIEPPTVAELMGR